MRADEWERAWRPVLAAVGNEVAPAGDPGTEIVEAETIRRWCEPLEFDCPLHHDAAVAQAHGHGDVVAPYTAVSTYAMTPLWSPGTPPLFREAGPNAQPARAPLGFIELPGAPATTGFFATDVEYSYTRPPRAGDRLRRGPRILTSCIPKQTTVGRGAFVTIAYAINDQHGEVVARCQTTFYYYNPLPEGDDDELD